MKRNSLFIKTSIVWTAVFWLYYVAIFVSLDRIMRTMSTPGQVFTWVLSVAYCYFMAYVAREVYLKYLEEKKQSEIERLKKKTEAMKNDLNYFVRNSTFDTTNFRFHLSDLEKRLKELENE